MRSAILLAPTFKRAEMEQHLLVAVPVSHVLRDTLETARRHVVDCGHMVVSPDVVAEGWGGTLDDADVLVATPRLTMDPDQISNAKNLRAILFPTIGVDPLDVGAVTELGIAVGHGAPPESVTSMAEATVLTIAALMYRMPQKQAALAAGRWREPPVSGRMLHGRTIGLLGFGRIGRATAALLAPWGVELLFHDPFAGNLDENPANARPASLDQLLRVSDVVSLHMSLTAETRGIVGGRELALMKPDAVLVNTSRGGLVDEAALVDALAGERLAGAALDVFEHEPLPLDNVLRSLPNVILTPHNIGHTQELMAALESTLIANLEAVLAGQPPLHLFNREVLPQWQERFGKPSNSFHAQDQIGVST